MKPRKYVYRRNLPHIEKADRPHFITFDTHLRWELPPAARDIALRHCLHDNGSKMKLHVVVVMPDHVHLIFTPLPGETGEIFSFEEILGGIKGASSHSINRALKRSGHVWQDESFDHVIRCQGSPTRADVARGGEGGEFGRKNRVRLPKPGSQRAGSQAGRLQMVVERSPIRPEA